MSSITTSEEATMSSGAKRSEASSHVLSKADIDQAGSTIRKADSTAPTKNLPNNTEYEVLDLYHHARHSSNEEKTNDPNSVAANCRGTIFAGDVNVVQTFAGPTREFTAEREEDREKIKQIFDGQPPNKLAVFSSEEGALVRVFHHGGRWFFATHRKFDAHRSKWASRKSFGSQLEDALLAEYNRNEDFRTRCGDPERVPDAKVYGDTKDGPVQIDKKILQFLDTLDKHWCHCFLVRSQADNRIVCKAPTKNVGGTEVPDPTLYHVGSFKKFTGEFSMNPDSGTGVPWPEKLEFDSWDQLYGYVTESNHEDQQGVIIYRSMTDATHVKVMGTRYKTLFAVRGNEPSIPFRYLQVRMNREVCDQLYVLYPNFIQKFEYYENILFTTAKEIHSAYVDRFIKKIYVTLETEKYQVMRACHQWHLLDRRKNRISVRQVIKTLNDQPPTALNKMVRAYIQAENAAARAAQDGTPASDLTPGSCIPPSSLSNRTAGSTDSRNRNSSRRHGRPRQQPNRERQSSNVSTPAVVEGSINDLVDDTSE